ncbi:MAG: trypsin-like peptidase domain-containing protein [Candidatus Berkelbacteria bacterium]|nr:trypsin-like peptidase domain-containing protein [Candidatus Berkelbacteria bacterium]
MNVQNRPLIVFLVILSFLTGIIGGIGGIALVASSKTLQKSVGIKTDSGIAFPAQEKVESISVKEDSAVVSSVKKVSPAVVSVVFTKDIQVINPFGSQFGMPDQSVQQQQGGGSGFILTSEGLIATNKHVADVDGAKYTVITQEGKKYDATVLAKDPSSDFAILKIDAKGLPVVEFGDSDNLDIGQRVIAIGNALGEFQNTVTVGVLSGKERTLTATDSSGGQSEPLEGLLQTDAAINEGNSGGPLLNLKGQVIGINTATAAKGQAEGLGFAIPINSLKSAVDSIKKTGKIVRPYLGVRYVVVDSKISAIKGMKNDSGILIVGGTNQPAIVIGSPADKAGLKEGDVILKVNNDDVGKDKSLVGVLTKYQPNDEVTLHILRDGKEMDVKARLGEMPS